ncbi:rhomboid family intramembrane serine protease [Plantibacter sp. CFBP 8804]|uniref:rhomboid family intramembrane serine protease n=1 Tax=Plantibacter sp. CFBP 8804 TaxID=2775270 RepID=UPI001784CFBB|nr:rhomboid family intramembrane serine protease [Plantibacter sp. CFBP 8804]
MDWLADFPPGVLLLVVFLVVAVESLGVPLPGETVLIGATLLAASSGLSPVFVAAAAAGGAILGDSIGYWIGKRYGRRLLSVLNRRFPKHVGPKRLGAAVHLMRRWGPWAVFVGRFIAVLRIFSGPLAGMFRMTYPHFLVANAAGGIAWASLVVTVVTVLGSAATEFLHRFSWAALALAGAAAVVIAVVVVFRLRRRAAQPAADRAPVSMTEAELDELLSPSGSASATTDADARMDTPTTRTASSAPVRTDLRAAISVVLTPLRWALRTTPATTAFVTVFVALGVVTGGLWRPIDQAAWYPAFAYGVPSLEAGRWWTVLTGMFITADPLAYLVAIVGAAVFGGWVEVRFGTLRASAIFVTGHLVGILGALGAALALARLDWPWAQSLVTTLAVGPSCGILACVATATAFMRSPYRLRWRLLLLSWVSIALLYVGKIDDLEHFITTVVFVIAARILLGEHRSTPRPTMRDWRLFAVSGLLVIGAVQLLVTLVPLDGPLGSTTLTQGSILDVGVDTIAILVIANWLRRGHRWAWWAAMALTVGNLLVTLALIALAWLAQVPLVASTIWISASVLWVGQAVVLVLSRHAFRVAANQTRRRLPGAIGPGARRARARAAQLLHEHGGGPLAASALRPENRVFVTADGGHAVAYQQHAGVALALGEPIGDPGGAAAAVSSFATAAEQEGLTPAVFATRDARIVPEGWRVSPLGRDLVLDLRGADASGPAGPDDATGATRADPTASILLAARELPWELRSQIRALSSVWVSDRHVPELGLTVGSSIDAPDDDDRQPTAAVRVSVVTDAAGAVLAAVSWLPIPGAGGTVHGWVLDAVRRALPKDDAGTTTGAGAGAASREHASRAVELALTDACRRFASEGASLVSFAASGLAQDGTEPDGVAVRTMAGIAHRVDPLVGFAEIADVAERLGATAVPLFLACREDADQPRVAYAAAAGFLTGIRLRDLPGLSGSLLVR